MNKSEQRAILKELLQLINNTRNALLEKEPIIEGILKNADQLYQSLYESNILDAFDLEEFTNNLFNELFSEELEQAYDELQNFKSDIDSLISEVSERRAETLSENFCNLEEVCEKFNQSVQEYDSVELAIEHIDEAIIMLKDMM